MRNKKAIIIGCIFIALIVICAWLIPDYIEDNQLSSYMDSVSNSIPKINGFVQIRTSKEIDATIAMFYIEKYNTSIKLGKPKDAYKYSQNVVLAYEMDSVSDEIEKWQSIHNNLGAELGIK